MLIVGELINTSRSKIREAAEVRDILAICDVARKQEEAGASYLDINCGTFVEKECEIMKWLVKTVRPVVSLPLCIDSPNPEALRVGLELCGDKPMINSTTFETPRFNDVVPLAIEFGAKLIALCIDDNGMPDTADQRVKIAGDMINKLVQKGMSIDDIYIDPLVKPMSANINNGTDVLNAVNRIMNEFKGVHTICGLTNISYSLPARVNINKTFMIQTMTMGMDAYILDITKNEMAGSLYASQLLLGQDNYCRNYIKAYRKGIYGA
ncbi:MULTISPECIES: methyltetrahydrofolate--corrinoid methyltransferase [unclassified Dehalobacter]|jgi:Methionine synthase I, cobalamin-binding domain|uniref:methyltetrahydrofolate--corrinoid methyltransferase n=1 Tax=unclassified Dehalobacter TaxID=2635733 RepID=UPI00028B1BB6|nr:MULTISPECIES: methyltetrahydrofolate--corrinoid methyltransferase [unclassified Dehalobacter]AFV03044.1 5-methyltetrahydrofolate--homocysteine methyltransferase [Dehalobacter sp. DCA]AFV06032.1 5-methyltetrahydrofolate--homocysteine methyltransferase [Dehalobacter sp. CF]